MRKSLLGRRLWATAAVPVVVICLGGPWAALGEAPPATVGGAGSGAPQGGGAGPGRSSGAIQVFDDRVFNLGQPPAPPAPNPNGRYAGEEPNYNTETRARALEACAGAKEVDSKTYRDCYQREMKRAAANVQDSFDRAQRRLNNPLRDSFGGGIPSPLDERAPAETLDEND